MAATGFQVPDSGFPMRFIDSSADIGIWNIESAILNQRARRREPAEIESTRLDQIG